MKNNDVDLSYFQEMSKRTINTKNNLFYYYFGIITESYELLENLKKIEFHKNVNKIKFVKEEIGDIFWYITNYLSFNNYNLKDFMAKLIDKNKYNNNMDIIANIEDHIYKIEIHETIKNMIICLSRFGIYAKTTLILNKEMEIELINIIYQSINISKYYKLSLKECLLNNINKLAIRYPNGYNKNDAILRRDKVKKEEII